jgi:hypothetical protein
LVFSGVGGKSVEREPNGLRGSCIQSQLGTAHLDTRAKKIGEGRELGADQVLGLCPMPFTLDEEVLVGRKRLDALGEAFDEIFGISGRGLVSDRVHHAEHVLGAMIDLAHEEVLPFHALLAFGNVLSGANHVDGASIVRGTLEMRKPVSLHPPDLAVPPLNPVFDRIGFRIGGIDRRFHSRPNPFHVVWMHPLRELLDVRLVFGNVVYLLRAFIRPQSHAVDWIVLPPPKLGCVEGQLQTIVHQRLLLLLLDGSEFRHVAYNREHHRFGEVFERFSIMSTGNVAIRTAGDEVEPCTHRPNAGYKIVFGAMGEVTFPRCSGSSASTCVETRAAGSIPNNRPAWRLAYRMTPC